MLYFKRITKEMPYTEFVEYERQEKLSYFLLLFYKYWKQIHCTSCICFINLTALVFDEKYFKITEDTWNMLERDHVYRFWFSVLLLFFDK